MKFLLLNHKYPIYLILIASIWLFLVAVFMQFNKQVFIFGDSRSYFLAAQELFLDHKLNSHRPLLISFINGFPLLFGFSKTVLFFWSLCVNLFCWYATILFTYLICKNRVNSKLAFQITVLFVICVGNLFIVFHLLSETIFTFILVLVFYLIQKYFSTKNHLFLMFCFFILGLSIMIKPLVLGIFLVFAFCFYKQLKDVFFNRYSIILYGVFLLLFFQMNGLKKQYGNFTVSYIDSFTYYNYLGTRADCLKNNTVFNQGLNARYSYFSKFSNSEQKKVAADDFQYQLKTNKINLLKAYFINLFINSTKGSASVFGCENRNNSNYFEGLKICFKILSKVQNCIFSVIAVVLSLYYLILKRAELFVKLIAFTISYIIGISGISSDQGDRFHIVLYPLILILAATFYQNKFKLFVAPLQK